MDTPLNFSKRYICSSHGLYTAAICPGCVDNLVDMLTSTVTTTAQSTFYNEPDPYAEICPVSLGRWEEQTEYDRDFLASCGISTK